MLRICLLGCLLLEANARSTVLNATRHLGIAGQPEWSIFEGRKPDGTNLVLSFDAPEVEGAQTLFIRQDDVKQDWTVTLNGKRLGMLFLMEAPLVHSLAVPAGLLKAQANRLEISGRAADEILIHEVWIEREPQFSPVQVSVRERGPCRITVVDEQGHLAALNVYGRTNLAVRPGVIYTPDGQVRVGLRPGRHTVYALRGPEFSVGEAVIEVPGTGEVSIEVKRQVDTAGWIAADTHMHTLALSKHGDASVPERVLTIAGEGLDLAIVTEHNLHADYAEAARELGLSDRFTSVPGNEVTTKKGHFNIFPVALAARPPDHTLENWPLLFEKIRATPDVRVAIINHPTDVHSGFVPFAATNLDQATGRNLRGDFDFEFDSMEVINSAAMNSDWMAPFRAWFALLNRGLKITAVASSDSHDVSRFIVGQGRTYIRGDDSNPGEIDVAQACENLKRGRAVASLGLFVNLSIRGAGPGDMVSVSGGELELVGRVAAPSWMKATKAVIYANGEVLIEVNAAASFTLRIPAPKHDTYYVIIAQGPGATNQFWSVARPYQPSSKVWEPLVIGATNPVWVDADGDGKFSSSRDYAKELMALPADEARAKLAEHSGSVAAHLAELRN